MFPWSSDADKIQRATENLLRANEELVTATKEGDVAKVRTLLKKGTADINGRDGSGLTPLYWASKSGYLQIVELLLKAKANPNAANSKGWTPLYLASDNGHSQVINELLKVEADPNAADTFGRTPLYWASSQGNLQAVKELLKAGANCNATDMVSQVRYYDRLVGRTDPAPRGIVQRPPASCGGSAQGQCESFATRALLAGGADPTAEDFGGLKPLHACILAREYARVSDQTLLTVQVLVSAGAMWDVKCDEIVSSGRAWVEAPALRLCVLLWAQEHVDGLEMSDILVEVINRGVRSTQAYIEALKTSHDIVFRRKICLVGSSCAGKTSFVKSITSKLLQPQLKHLDDRTIGIDHFPLRIEQIIASRNDTKVHEVTFWDFASQDAYQVAHSLFFSPRTLFLVFVDLESFAIAYMQAVIIADEEFQETRLLDEFVDEAILHWIRMILARQADAEFVFLAAKKDLLKENTVTESLLKDKLMEKLQGVGAVVEQMKMAATVNTETPMAASKPDKNVAMTSTRLRVIFVSCTSRASIRTARAQVDELVTRSTQSVPMPDDYSKALEAIVKIREDAKALDTTKRIDHVFHTVDTLPEKLQIKPELCKLILQTLHDLGDVLWYENLGDLFRDSVILDPLLLIDFIRQIITHKHTDVTMPHADLKSKPFWMGLSSRQHMKAMKQVLQEFHLVYSADEDRIMAWDSDLIVPAFWQTKIRAVWKFLSDILRINRTQSRDGEAVRIHWEFQFEFGLPSSLFDHVVVASVSPYVRFDAGPDWIVYEETGIAACRIMVSRDMRSLHRTIRIEAVVAEAATKEQIDNLWLAFQRFCGAFMSVLREHRGLAVSSFAWDVANRTVGLKRLVQSKETPPSARWMPPLKTWEWFKPLFLSLHQVEKGVLEQLEKKLNVSLVLEDRKVLITARWRGGLVGVGGRILGGRNQVGQAAQHGAQH